MSDLSKGGAPIIIVKKVIHQGGHHGGAWKVAYADFVTAMMALFIVLWLLSSSEQVKKAVGGYFQDPTGQGKQTGSTNAGFGETLAVKPEDLENLKEKLEQLMSQMPTFDRIKDQVKMVVTAEGLRIDLMEKEGGMFFESGNPNPSVQGTNLLAVLSKELSRIPNKIAIEGHTDSRPFGKSEYSNWELSADRANSARRIMQEEGLRADQVSQVRGFADQRLMNHKDASDPRNRRISIIVRSQLFDIQELAQIDPAQSAGKAAAAGHGAAPKESGHAAPAHH